MSVLCRMLVVLGCVVLPGCVVAPPTDSPTPGQIAAIKHIAISVAAPGGAQGTATLLSPDWMLFVRHMMTRDHAENLDGLGVDTRATIVLEGVGELNEDDWFCPSLSARLEQAGADWRLLRLITPDPRPPVPRYLPVSAQVRVGDRVVIGGYIPRLMLQGEELARKPKFWSSVGIVTNVSASGAFAVVLGDEGSEPGCSGSPVLRLNTAGEPEAVVGIFTGDYTGPALPRLIQSYAACAPIVPAVADLISQGWPSTQDGHSAAPR